MPNRLLSGPAGAAKSQRARELLDEAVQPVVVADFTSIFNAIRLIERGPDGKFPTRTEADRVYLPIAEAVRLTVIDQAVRRGLDLVVTSSDGDQVRRQFLLSRMGDGAVEEVLDPGEAVVRARLADPITGELSTACASAINRWYTRR